MTDTTLLHAVLRAEGIRRAQQAALKQSESAERDAIVANLHECFHKQAAGVMDLLLMGHDCLPVTVRTLQQGHQVCHCYGITLHLSRKPPAELTLAVRSRTIQRPAHISISIRRHYPAPSEHLLTLPGHAAPHEAIAHFLAALMRHVHPHQLSGGKP